MGARLLGMQEATGSNPVGSTTISGTTPYAEGTATRCPFFFGIIGLGDRGRDSSIGRAGDL